MGNRGAGDADRFAPDPMSSAGSAATGMMQHQDQTGRRGAFKFVGFGAKILTSLAALAYLSTKVERDVLVQTIGGADLGFVLAAILALALQPLLATIRWWELLRAMAMRVGFGRLLQIVYVALFFNQVLPASLGADVIRVWLVRRDGCSLSKGVTSVFLDRLVMMLVLLMLVVLGYFVLRGSLAMPEANLFVLVALFASLAIFILLIALKTKLLAVVSRRLWNFIAVPVQNMRMFLVRPKALASVTLFSLASHANIFFTVFLLMLAFGARASFVEVAGLMPLVLVAATLPISLGGWGVRELAMVTAFAQLGVPEAAALSASVMLGIISIVVTLPGAAIFATLRRDARGLRPAPERLREVEAPQNP